MQIFTNPTSEHDWVKEAFLYSVFYRLSQPVSLLWTIDPLSTIPEQKLEDRLTLYDQFLLGAMKIAL